VIEALTPTKDLQNVADWYLVKPLQTIKVLHHAKAPPTVEPGPSNPKDLHQIGLIGKNAHSLSGNPIVDMTTKGKIERLDQLVRRGIFHHGGMTSLRVAPHERKAAQLDLMPKTGRLIIHLAEIVEMMPTPRLVLGPNVLPGRMHPKAEDGSCLPSRVNVVGMTTTLLYGNSKIRIMED
jgi:hypothetical protein